jgi:hypothetical protein
LGQRNVLSATKLLILFPIISTNSANYATLH